MTFLLDLKDNNFQNIRPPPRRVGGFIQESSGIHKNLSQMKY